jgi:hypothetical protein
LAAQLATTARRSGVDVARDQGGAVRLAPVEEAGVAQQPYFTTSA